jgi:uncharacterized membrane protein YjjP (DUF1212 family)
MSSVETRSMAMAAAERSGALPEPIDMAITLAAVVMRSGGATGTAERTFRNVLRGAGMKEIGVAWRLDYSVALSQPAGVRALGPIRSNLLRAAEALALSERVAGGEVALRALPAEIESVNSLAPPYDRGTTAAAAAVCGAAYSFLSGGDWNAAAIVILAAAVGQIIRSELGSRGAPGVVVYMICSVISASLAATGVRLGLTAANAATLIASVAYMFPGLLLINGFTDVVSERYLIIGMQRIANALLLFVILAVGIAFAVVVVL